MAHGGGTWLTQNKVMPGTYINFTSLAKASAALSDRGIAAAPFELNWGPEGTVFEVTFGDFQKNSKTQSNKRLPNYDAYNPKSENKRHFSPKYERIEKFIEVIKEAEIVKVNFK